MRPSARLDGEDCFGCLGHGWVRGRLVWTPERTQGLAMPPRSRIRMRFARWSGMLSGFLDTRLAVHTATPGLLHEATPLHATTHTQFAAGSDHRKERAFSPSHGSNSLTCRPKLVTKAAKTQTVVMTPSISSTEIYLPGSRRMQVYPIGLASVA